ARCTFGSPPDPCATTKWRSRPKRRKAPPISRARWRRSVPCSAPSSRRGDTASSPPGRPSSDSWRPVTGAPSLTATASLPPPTRAWPSSSAASPRRPATSRLPLRGRGPAIGRVHPALPAFMPAGDLLAGGEPHAAELPHEAHEVFQELDAGGAAAHEGVAGEDEAAVLGVHGRKLLAPHLEHPPGIGDGIGGAVHMA